MARSINQIQDVILNKVAASAALSAMEVLTDEEKSVIDITSESKVSIWRSVIWLVSFGIFVFEQIMDIFRAEIIEVVKNNRPHSEDDYKRKALAFQYGDVLVDSDEYAVIDVNKQIIKQVAIVEGDRKIVIKVATLQDDELVKLPDINQVNAFVAYMNDVKDAGTLLQIVNEDADKLKTELDFYYDALLVKDDGTTILDGVNVVETAINDYLKSLDFNGDFKINKMVDFIQDAVGYKDLKINFVGFKAGLSSSYTPIERSYQPLSGYLKLDEITVNYIAIV